MNKLTVFLMLALIHFGAIFADDDVVGFWKTIDDKTHKAQSIVAIYPYQGKIYGRMIATLDENEKVFDTLNNPKEHAKGVEGDPFFVGLDMIWNLQKQKDSQQYAGGKIMDPDAGKIYTAEMWMQDGKLIVRGEILVFGKNQEWVRATDADFSRDFPKPDISKFVPKIPVVKKSRHS